MPQEKAQYHTSHLVDGYRKAFVDSSIEAQERFTPSFVSNAGNETVRDVIIEQMKGCDELFMSVAFITSGGLVPFLGYLKEMEEKGILWRRISHKRLSISLRKW